jgi:thioesterase domain-containing protein/acyl carrier protein
MDEEKSPMTDLSTQNSIEKTLISIWERVLNIKDLEPDTDFFDSGGDSLTALTMVSMVEQETGKRLPISSLFENPTIEQFARLLKDIKSTPNWSCLVNIKKSGTKPAMYIVHGSGLNILVFNPLAKYINAQQPLYGIQALGLNGEKNPHNTIEGIAKHYKDEILRNDPVGPYLLAGYSSGGILAYEMAKGFLEIGKDVKMLAILDTYVGDRYSYTTIVKEFSKKVFRQFKKLLFFSKLFIKNPKELYQYQIKIIKLKLNKNAIKAHPEEFPYQKEVSKKYDQAFSNYIMKPLDIEIDLFKVKKRIYFLDDPFYLGWSKYAKKGLKVHEVTGDHKTFLFPPNDQKFAEVFQSVIDERIKN